MSGPVQAGFRPPPYKNCIWALEGCSPSDRGICFFAGMFRIGSLLMTGILPTEYCCPLCESSECEPYFEDANRAYLRCGSCRLIFVPPTFWLSDAEEKAEYDLHENTTDDPGYRNFLSRLTVPMLEKLGAEKRGLDFGCGPGPMLSVMLEEQGHRVELYDPFYANDPSLLEAEYDFICATEVAEHLSDPQKEFSTLFSCLKPGGWLGIMTKLTRDDRDAFANWHYIRDRTHIAFYHRETFSWMAQCFNAEEIFIGSDVILMKKRGQKFSEARSM